MGTREGGERREGEGRKGWRDGREGGERKGKGKGKSRPRGPGTAQKYFIRDVKGKLCSKFDEGWPKLSSQSRP